MNDPKVTTTDTKEQDTTPQEVLAKKPYEKPEIVYRVPLEVMAAVCDIGLGGKQACTTLFS